MLVKKFELLLSDLSINEDWFENIGDIHVRQNHTICYSSEYLISDSKESLEQTKDRILSCFPNFIERYTKVLSLRVEFEKFLNNQGIMSGNLDLIRTIMFYELWKDICRYVHKHHCMNNYDTEMIYNVYAGKNINFESYVINYFLTLLNKNIQLFNDNLKVKLKLLSR